MRVFNPKFVKKEEGSMLIDARRAVLAGTKEIEVYYDKEANDIGVVFRRSKKGDR